MGSVCIVGKERVMAKGCIGVRLVWPKRGQEKGKLGRGCVRDQHAK